MFQPLNSFTHICPFILDPSDIQSQVGDYFFLKSPLSWGCIMVVGHKCPVNEILSRSELKLCQNNISCLWCCSIYCCTRDRLWIYLRVGALIWKLILLVLRTSALQFKLLQLTNVIGSIFSWDIAPSAGGRCFKHLPKSKNEENCIPDWSHFLKVRDKQNIKEIIKNSCTSLIPATPSTRERSFTNPYLILMYTLMM